MRSALLLLAVAAVLPGQTTYDLILRNGRVIDGTGNPWFRADVAVAGGRIAAVGNLRDATALVDLDVKGLLIAPGFIDIHSHGRRNLERVPTAENYVRQGVTTIVEGNDGSSPLPLGSYLTKLSQTAISINFATFVGQGSIRQQVMGLVNRPSTPEELNRMRALTDQAMRDGAFGLSTGLFYVPGNFTPTAEVVELAKVVARYGGMHISHMREEAGESLASVQEVIRIGEEGGLPTQVTHHKIIGKQFWGLSEQTLALVNAARARGVDVTVDQYPYTASSTGTAALFPQWSLEGGNKALQERLQAPAQRARIKAAIVDNIVNNRGGGDPKNVVLAGCGFDASLAGKNLAELAVARGGKPEPADAAEAAMDLQNKGGCSAIYHAIGEADIGRILRYPHTMIASDGEIPIFGEANPHPRSYGTFARVLGRYVREQKVITIEEAIRKMSWLPAQRLGLRDRGLVKAGLAADLVVFDPETVADRSTFEKPHQYAEGFRHVLVNGELGLKDGQVTSKRSGRILRGPGYAAPSALPSGQP